MLLGVVVHGWEIFSTRVLEDEHAYLQGFFCLLEDIQTSFYTMSWTAQERAHAVEVYLHSGSAVRARRILGREWGYRRVPERHYFLTLYYFLWGRLKATVFAQPVRSLRQLRTKIAAATRSIPKATLQKAVSEQ